MNPFALEDLTPAENAALYPGFPLLVAYAGSHAHGTHQPPKEGGIDDVDIIAVCYYPLSHYFGLPRRSDAGTHSQIKQWDCSGYELGHFIRLALACNPNVICALWNEPDKYLFKDGAGELLIFHRELFSSRRAYKTFAGYAQAQIQRMTAYHDTGEATCCKGEQFHTSDCAMAGQLGRGSQKKFATGYMGQKRKALVEQFGYDCKNAAHALRLLAMGREFLQTGRFNVDRSKAGDAELLISVKRGEHTLAWVKERAQAMFDELKDARDNSPLPDEPDVDGVDRLMQHILSNRFCSNIVMLSQAYDAPQALLQRHEPAK